MYAPVDTTLPFVGGVVVFCIVAQFIDAVLYLFLPARQGGKQVASPQFIISFFDFVSNLVSSVVYTSLSIISALLGGLVWGATLVVFGSLLYLVYEEYPWVWTDLARSYNAFLGPLVQNTVVESLRLSDIVLKGVVPIWNGLVFFVIRLFSGYTLPALIAETPVLTALGAAVFDLFKHLISSLFDFLQPILVNCPESSGDACYEVANRTLDLLTPMADARRVVTHAVVLSKSICSFSGPVLDVLSFPFMDINFAGAVHSIVNAVLYLLVSTSKVTFLRCTRHGGEEPLMCTPDLEPVFVFLASGMRSLGFFLDNWLNVVYVIVQGVLGWSQISCAGELVPTAMDTGPMRAAIFGSNHTVLVGLTGSLAAITDGSVVSYEGHGHLRLATWPSAVNISHGVAAVTYGRSSDADVSRLSSAASGTSTSLFGCACAHDPDLGMQVQCSVLPFGGLLASETGTVPVFFQQGGAVQTTLRCSDVDIVVQSVRWPATRFSSPTGGGAFTGAGGVDCVTSRTCSKVDATVWLVPRVGCDSESAVCDCFPFCMAARLSGSQASPLIFYSASQWRSKVFLLERDCNLHTVSSDFDGGVSKAVASDGVTSVQVSGSTGVKFVGGSHQTISCVDNLLVTTLVNRSLHPSYSTPTPAFLRNPVAPFVVTGDTVLTSVLHGDGGYTVRVERLTGAAGHEFTLSVVSNNFPAAPPPSVPSALFKKYPRDHLTIPYSRLGTVAVSSRDYVFYAVNPATEVFDAYLHYCRNNGNKIDQFGLIMVSSYSPIRVWRVDAYRRCGVSGCGSNLVKQVDIPGAFSDGTVQGTDLSYDCDRSFNEAITQLEYMNEINIAVTVRHTDVIGSFVEYRTYYLHPKTMLLRGPGMASQGPWDDDIPVTALNAYSLCPAMQILPELGSMTAELLLAGVFLIKLPLDTVLYLPGILNLWSKGVVCPLKSRGHSVLQQCGVNAFSLEDFFSSLQTATNIFWSSLTLLSSAVGGLGSTGFVENGLNGLARYGAGTIDLWTVRFQVLNLMKEGPSSVLQAMPTTVISGASGVAQWAQGPLKVSSNALGWARFGYGTVAKIVVTIAQNVAMNKPVDSSGAWRIVVNTLDEMHGYYDSFVVDNMRQACAGLSLMLGISNPWARFVYHQCLAANTMVESGLGVVLSVFNLAPFTQCMCSGSSGRAFGDYAKINCIPQASTTLRPVLLEMIQSSGRTASATTAAQALCSTMLSYTRTSLVSSMQPWFDSQEASLDALAASVDYVLFWLDPKAGDCLDFDQDPDVVVIMPYPSDYFQACGRTSLCRSRCSGVFEAFDASLAAAQAVDSRSEVTVEAESLFFPALSVDAFTPLRIHAMVQPPPGICLLVCGKSGDYCVAVAGVAGGRVMVQHYCVPQLATSSVVRTVDTSLEWMIDASQEWGNDIVQLQFGDAEALYLVALVSSGDLYMASSSGTVLLTSLSLQTNDIMAPVLQISSMMAVYLQPYVCVSINILYRMVDGRITGQLLHRKLVVNTLEFPDISRSRWVNLGAASQFFIQLQGYSASHVVSTTFDSISGAQFLLLPRSEGMAVNLWTLKWDTQDVTNGLISWSVETLPTPSGAGALISSGQTLSQNCVIDSEGAFIAFAGAPEYQSTAWLSQLRVSGVTASSYKSQRVPVRVETVYMCDINSCLGCPDGETQRLCDAAQRCAVVRCIGTPVNMRRVLCQVGQVMADDARQSLALLHGTWVIFVDMFMTLMDLSLQKGLTGVSLTWPDDRFFGYICTIKDNNAHMISVLTSALNSVIQMGHSAVMFLQGGAPQIDSNFNALVTMPLTALTNLANQVALAPLYPLIVVQKVMMCRANGVLGIFDVTGYTVRVGDASMQEASARLVGQCLTQNFVVKNQNPIDAANSGSTARIVSQLIQSSATALLPQLTFMGLTLETLMHFIDGQLSYWMGIVYGVSDLLQSLDMAHCKLPDYFLNETMFCACGDTQFVIPAIRRSEKLQEIGLWCTGTLTMLDAVNQPFVIYNPFSYAELQSMALRTDAYLACMSGKSYGGADAGGDCHSLRPSAPALETQGVSVLTVLTACRNNYMHKQWDRGAHVIFNRTLFKQIVNSKVDYPALPVSNPLLTSVGKCLANPATRAACLQFYLTRIGQSPEIYWMYEEATPGPSQTVDACEVFTGPAGNEALTTAQRSVFRACLDQYADSNCQLSSSLWTPQSDNAVPVAQRHGVRLSGESAITSIVQLKFEEARALVLDALGPLRNYNNNDVLTVFFSPEGDIMHQMMDCVFMGPYPRVDYWPVDTRRMLSIPSWHRDSNGSSRQIDPRKCVLWNSDKIPPYSCGSPARQAVIKYFFRDYLPRQQNATLKSVIGGLVDDLAAVWNSTSNYSCLCGDKVSHSLSCCQANSSVEGVGSWLPPGLSTVYQTVPANHILRALTTQLQDFYRFSLEEPQVWTKYLDENISKSYDWTDVSKAAVAVEEALFRNDKPVVGYDSAEVNSPMLTTGLWHQCHGLLSQIFFTIPMQNTSSGQWWPRESPPDGRVDGLDGLSAFVRSAVREAYTHSPLFRHYNVSYVPSDSRLCRPSQSERKSSLFVANPPRRAVRISSFSVSGVEVMNTSGWRPFPAYGVDAFPLHGCFCGWDGDGVTCTPPPVVCGTLPSLCPSFSGASSAAVDLIMSAWSPQWPCPALSISDHAGLMASNETDAWLSGADRDFTVLGSDLLRRGRSGLRVGNADSIGNLTKWFVSPRDVQIDQSRVALPFCATDYAQLSGKPLLDASMFSAFVAAIFPVGQGVFESSTTAYCLRFLIELGILEAMTAVYESNALSGSPLEEFYVRMSKQQETADVWRVRCESQISMLSLCKNLDVYQPPVARENRIFPCPFSVAARDSNDIYTTPGCLVHSGGFFYDPCNCAGFVCGPGKPLFSLYVSACRIPFDPRDSTISTPLGEWRVSPLRALKSDFVDKILTVGDSVGNMPRGSAWHRGEGFMNTTGLHCDMLTDWWPENETLPVGFHATVPCGSEETGYRSFDSAFAVERGGSGQFTVVKMVYQHDLTRDASKIDTHLGAGGVCRFSSLGMPFYQTNTMQVCTRQLLGDHVLDPAVPVQQSGGAADHAYGPASCSADSTHVPWHSLQDRQDSALHSVGTVPNMPDPTTGTSYPPDNVYFGVGPKEEVMKDLDSGGTGWGTECSDFAIKECESNADCPLDYHCPMDAGVCMSNDFLGLQHCYRHDMCPEGYLCSGVGKCVEGFIVILNNLNGSVEAPVFSEQCDETTSDSYPTDGSSPWEYVPDWMVGHGMCSNKNWYMYMVNYLALQANGTCSLASCRVDAKTATLGSNGTRWWPDASSEPQMFALKPTLCDRDYEHLKGPSGVAMKGCSPKNTLLENQVTNAFSDVSPLTHAGLFRNFDNKKTSLLEMPFVGLSKSGFLGFPVSTLTSGGSSTNILNCEKYQNCYAYSFTFNGVERSPRLIRRPDTGLTSQYVDDDIFRCGVSAYYDSATAKCRLDSSVLPLYVSLCKTPSVIQMCTCPVAINDGVGCKAVVQAQKVRSICDNILEEFSAGYSAIQSNTKYLQDLFNVFVQSDGSLTSHVSGVECFEAIYGNMQTTRNYGSAPMAGVYFPFSFALYEIPLAWLYQCVRLGGITIDTSASRIRCQQFEQSKSLDKALLYPEGMVSFHFDVVKGGYRRSDVVQSIDRFRQHFLSAWPELANIPEFANECAKLGQTQCKMVPYCAFTQEWIPNSQMDLNTRHFLAGMYQDVCGSTVKDYVLKISGLNFAEFVAKNTRLKDFFVQRDRRDGSGLREIEDIIKSAISGCMGMSYLETARWPLSFSIDMKLSECVDFVTVLNQLSMELVRQNYIYSNNDLAYMPNQNLASQLVTNVRTTPEAGRGCIFNDLADQIKFYDPSASPASCPFVNRRCAAAECKDYPLVFATGEQGCRYPMQNNYTGLSYLVQYVWGQMKGPFNSKLQTLPKFTPAPPAPLAFFEDSTRYFPGWSFDLTGLQRYMSNINPDTSKELMCVLSSAREAVNFTACNDRNYEALSSFTQSFRRQGPAVIPAASQLRWKVSQSFLSRGALFAFANSTREDAKVLLRNLFNTDTRCGVNEKMFNRVCLAQVTGSAGTSIRPWVPWVSGEWNPYEFCDVRLLELNQGNQEIIWPYDVVSCPDCPSTSSQYRKSYMLDTQSPTCDSRQLSYAKAVNVDPEAPTNICYIRMQNSDSACTHAQGMVGGERGQSVLNHPQMPNLYGTANLSSMETLHSAGIFPRSPRTLLSGRTAEEGQYGFISVPGDELGVTAIGLSIEQQEGEVPLYKVDRLPLQPEVGFMEQWATKSVSEGWVQNLNAVFGSEHELHALEQRTRGNSAWDCPVRRAAFYSRSMGSPFIPALPSPGRSRRIFGNLTQGRSTHPTFEVSRDGSALGYYTTSNGFCFCPSNMSSQQRQCLIPLTNLVHNCSLKRTIDALRGGWVQSFAFPPASATGADATCRMQFDWPYVGGTLRDGTTHGGAFAYSSDPIKSKCHVVDRLRPFLYSYRSGGGIKKIPGSTLDRGGVCHTGRAATVTAEATARLTTTRCVKHAESDSSIDVSCEDGTTLTLSKERSAPLDQMVAQVAKSRTRCSECAAPPVFTDSRRQQIKAESSFGIPFRFSASRAVALDLRRMVCGENSTQCEGILNQTAWTSDNFMRALLTSPRSLFVGSASPQERSPLPSQRDPAWETEWVFCNTTDELKAGACRGSIQESAWRTDRFQSCYKSIRDLTRDSPDTMSSVDVCLTDSNLQALCLAVQRAQTLVRQANCLASGSSECILKPFVYLPSAWDVSNQAFVHQTVRRFYSRITSYACPSTVEAVRTNNQAIANRCAAHPVGAMYLGLQACRDIVDALAQVVFYMANILLNGFLLIFAQDKSVLMAQIVYYWGSMAAVIQDLLSALSDIFFDMLFHMGAMGQRIYNLLRSACGIANKAYQYWLEVWCGLLIDLAPMLMGALRQVSEYSEVISEVLNTALGVIFRFLAPEALSTIQSLGYTKHFRDRKAADMAREKQIVHDTLVVSKREGKSVDEVSQNIKRSRVSRYGTRGGSGSYDQALQGALMGVGLNLLDSAGVYGQTASLLVDFGTAIFQTTELKRLYDLYPDNWTLFDFQTIYTALDTFEYFISTNDQCLAYRASGIQEVFNCSFPPLASKDSLAGAMLVATRCWADAQRDIGTSNLLACTESDTCYKSLYDTTTVVCASCPDAGEGYSLYGCSPVTKMCTCSVPSIKPSSCTHNEQCQYASSTCLLVTGLDFMSYGNQPCTECTKQVQCLIRDDSGIGQCGCVFQVQPIQQCTHPPGKMVEITAPNKVCGYLPNADRTQSVAVSHWDAIALTQCLYLNPASVYCVQVYQDTGMISMAVGLTMASMASAFQSRRLLSEGNLLPNGQFELHRAESEYALPDSPAMHSLLMEDWNNTAAPCSALAWAYQQNTRMQSMKTIQMGPLDTMALHRCAYWRQVGRETIRLYNLTSLRRSDGFLLSTDDFAAALSQKSVLVDLIKSPEAMIFMAAHLPALKPLYAALLTFRSMAMSMSLSMNSTRWHKLPLHDMWHQVWHQQHILEEDLDVESLEKWAEQGIREATNEGLGGFVDNVDPNSSDSVGGIHPTRKLLQSDTIKFAESWLSGPFTWPPTFYTYIQTQECSLGTAVVQITHNILEVLLKFYYNSYPKPPPPPTTLRGNLPDLTPVSSDILHGTTSSEAVPYEGWIASTYHWVWSFFGIDVSYARSFFSNVQGQTNIFTVSTSMLQCDFPAVTYCTNHKKDLVMTTVLLVILYMIVAYFARLVGLPILATMMIWASVPLTLWYSYGMALTCGPMLPTCLLEDVIRALDSFFPLSVTVPAELSIVDDCLNKPELKSCFKSCGVAPLSFNGWRDTLAFGVCYLDIPTCRRLADIISWRDSLGSALLNKADTLQSAGEDRTSAMRLCFLVTSVNLIPVMVLVVLFLTSSVYLLYLPCVIIPKFLTLSLQSLAYTHASGVTEGN